MMGFFMLFMMSVRTIHIIYELQYFYKAEPIEVGYVR